MLLTKPKLTFSRTFLYSTCIINFLAFSYFVSPFGRENGYMTALFAVVLVATSAILILVSVVLQQLESEKIRKFLIEKVKTETVDCYLASMDGGQNWYVAKVDKHQGRKDWVEIIGHVEEIHPGLLSTIRARQELQEFAVKNGPNSFVDIRNSQLLRMRAGLISVSEEVQPTAGT